MTREESLAKKTRVEVEELDNNRVLFTVFNFSKPDGKIYEQMGEMTRERFPSTLSTVVRSISSIVHVVQKEDFVYNSESDVVHVRYRIRETLPTRIK